MATNTSFSRSVPQLTAPSLSAKQLEPKHINAKHLYVPGKAFISKNKPVHQHVKDLGDLLLGDVFAGTKQLQNTLDDNGVEYFKYVPIINRVVGAGLMIKERTIDPALKGQFGRMFLNNLETVGSTLDTLANPVKSLMPWAGGGTSQDLLKSMGWLEGEYRQYYKWNTGNWLLDVVGEMLSDPLTYVTLGADVLAKAPANEIADVTTQATKQVLKTNSDDIAKLAINAITDDVMSDSGEVLTKLYKTVDAERIKVQDVLKTLPKGTARYNEYKQLVNTYKAVLKPGKWSELADTISAMRNTDLYKKYALIRKTSALGNKTQEGLIQASQVLAPSWGVAKALKDSRFVKETFASMFNRMTSKLKNYELTNPNSTLTNKVTFLDDAISADAYARFKTTYDSFEPIMARYHLNRDALTALWRDLWINSPAADRTIDNINNLFIQELLAKVPILKEAWSSIREKATSMLPEQLVDIAEVAVPKEFTDWVVQNIDKRKIESLVEATQNTALTQVSARALLAAEYKKQVDIDMANFFKTQGKQTMEQYRPTQVIKYLDEELTTLDGVHYGIKNLDKFLNALNNTDAERYQNIVAVLDYIGIDLNNYTQIDNLYQGIKAGKHYLGRKLKQELTNNKKGIYLDYKNLSLFEQNYLLKKPLIDKRYVLAKNNTDEAKLIEQKVNSAWTAQYVTELEKYGPAARGNIDTVNKYINKAAMETINTGSIESVPNLNYQVDPHITRNKLKPEQMDNVTKFLYEHDMDLDDIEDKFKEFWQDHGSPTAFGKVRNLAKRFKEELITDLKTNPDTGLQTIKVSKETRDQLDDVINVLINDISSTATIVPIKAKEIVLNNKERLYNELDAYFGKYAGTADEDLPSSIIKQFADLDFDLADPVGINTAWDRLKKSVAIWYREIHNYNTESYPQHITQFIRDLHTYLQTDIAAESHANLLKLAESHKTWYYMELTAQARTDLVYQHMLTTFGGMDSKTKLGAKERFLKAIMDRDGKFREAIEEELSVMKASPDLNVKLAGNYLNETLARLDGMAALQELLNKDFVDPNLPRSFNSYIAGLIHDVLYNQGQRLKASSFVSDPSYLTNMVMDSFKRYHLNPEFDNWKLYNAIADMTGITDPDRLMELCNETLDSITKNVSMQISAYIKHLMTIQKWSNIEVPIYFSITGKGVDLINSLKYVGEEYSNIAAHLSTRSKANAEAMDEFIRRMTGYIKRSDLVPADRIDRMNYFANIQHIGQPHIYTQVDYSVNETLTAVLKEVFDDIKAINDSLSGTTERIDIGLEEAVRANVNYIAADQLNALMQEWIGRANAFDAALSNGYIGFKKIMDKEFIRTHYLDPKYFPNITQPDYFVLYGNLESGIELFNKIDYKNVLRSDWYIMELRRTLADFYSNNRTECGPADPVQYFIRNPLSDADVLAWDRYTSNTHINASSAAVYEEAKNKRFVMDSFNRPSSEVYKNTMNVDEALESLDRYAADPYYSIMRMNALEQEGIYVDTDGYLDLIGNAPIQEMEAIVAGARKPLRYRMKSIDNLKQYTWYYDNYIKNNIGAINRVDRILSLERNTKTVGEVLDLDSLTDNERKILTNNRIYKETPMNNRTVNAFMKRERDTSKMYNIKRWTPEQLRSYIDDHKCGALFLVNEQDYIKSLDKSELNKAGLTIINVNKNVDVLLADTAKHAHVDYDYQIPKYIFKQEQQRITNLFKKNARLFPADLPAELNTGETVVASDLKFLLKTPKIAAQLKKMYPGEQLDDVIERIAPLSAQGGRVFNSYILGSSNALNTFIESMQDTFENNNVNIMSRFNKNTITRAAMAGNFAMVYEQDKLRKYLEIFFNDDYYLGNDLWTSALKDASDAEIADLFKAHSYVAAVLKEDKNGEPLVKQLYVTNRKTLDDAIEQSAVLLPYETFRNVTLVINERKSDNRLLNFFKGAVTGFYKANYLATLGFLFRNELDSVLYKNNASTLGIKSIKLNLENQNLARQLLQFYDDIQRRAIDIANGNTLNKRILLAELKKLSPEQRTIYMFVDLFINSPASGGYSAALENLMMTYNLAKNPPADDLLGKLEQGINEITASDVLPMKHINNINNVIEQTARLGHVLTQMQNGSSFSRAIMKTIDTHFDYKFKNNFREIMEQLFWFSTFPINNMMYYLNEGFTKNPSMLFLLMDAQEASWDSQGYTWEQVRNNDYYAYNAMVGNIRFNFLGRDVLLKTGSSAFDFFSLLFDPFGEIADRLNPFLATLFGIEKPSELNPFVGYGTRAKQLATRVKHMSDGTSSQHLTGSFIPSVYSLIPHYDNNRKYPRRIYNSNNKGTWTTYPRRPRRIYSRMRRAYSPQTYRYYFDRGRNYHMWLNRTSSIEPFWYHHNYYNARKNRIYTYPRKTYNHR